MTEDSQHIDAYEHALAPARRAFAGDPAVEMVQHPAIGAAHLEAFLIHYCALGVAMTGPVEDWIRRAGQACDAAGFRELGTALQRHARAEADHHLLMLADLRRLCARRATAGRPPLHPADLLALPWPASTHRYRRLHEDVIAGPTPYAQIAVENEIEMLSVEIGPGLLANARALLGEDVLADLSFLTEHVALDVGHTAFNRRQLSTFLRDHPGTLDALVAAGSEALDAYRAFVVDCLTQAGALAGAAH